MKKQNQTLQFAPRSNNFLKRISAAFLLLLVCQWVSAHGGEDHGDAPKAKAVSKNYFSTEAVSDVYELFLKYQPLEAGKDAHLMLYISDFNTNKPVDDAQLQIALADDDASKFEAKKIDKGIYELHGNFKEKKVYSLNVSINSSLGADLLQLSGIDVGKELPHAEGAPEIKPAANSNFQMVLLFAVGFITALIAVFAFSKIRNKKTFSVLLLALCLLPLAYGHEGHDDSPSKSGNNSSPTFLVAKETQFLFEVLTQKVETGNFTESTKFFGTVVPSSAGKAVVTSPQSGKINSLNVNVGQKVSKGQLLAIVEQNIDAGTQVNLLSEKNNIDAEYEAARKNYERIKAIEDIAAKKDVDEATARYQKAQENKKVLDNLTANSSGNSKLIFLKSPISGVVGNFTFSLGATVNNGEELFSIVNLNTVYVEAQVFDRDAERVRSGKKFMVECTNNNHKCSEVKIISMPQSINPTNQSQRLLFEMENQDGEFKIGEFVNVRVFAGEAKKEIAVPNSAISQLNGKPIVFIKDAAESYSMVYVNTGENNGSFTTIKSGIEDGERVVTNSTYQIKMIYLNQ